MPRISFAVAVAVLVAPVAVFAAGGRSIASAPDIPLGQGVNGTTGEFWRVTLRPRDLLVANLTSISGGRDVRIGLLDPAVDDFTLDRASWVATRTTKTRTQFRFIATKPGKWTMQVVNSICFHPDEGYCREGGAGYELMANVLAFTRSTLTGPRFATPGQKITFRGRVTGASTGQVLIQTAKPRGGWKAVAVRPLRNGAFSWTTRTIGPGTYRVRAVYAGDASHQPSRATASVVVVGE